MNVVLTATPLTSACESDAKFDPVSVSVYVPTVIGAGITLVSEGVMRTTVSFVDPTVDVRDVLRAAIVKTLAAGITTGGV